MGFLGKDGGAAGGAACNTSATDQWQSGEQKEPSSRGPQEGAPSADEQLAHVGGRSPRREEVVDDADHGGREGYATPSPAAEVVDEPLSGETDRSWGIMVGRWGGGCYGEARPPTGQVGRVGRQMEGR